MRIWLGVENFAKIESAKICINKYTVLVGHNNSGKTFLMQLAQGIRKKLNTLIEEDILDIWLSNKISKEEAILKEEYTFTISDKNIEELISYLNKKLEQKKDALVEKIFGKKIQIKRLYIDIDLEDCEYELILSKHIKNIVNLIEKYNITIPSFFQDINEKVDGNVMGCSALFEQKLDTKRWLNIMMGVSDQYPYYNVKKMLSVLLMPGNSLFFPASRAGLMMMYRSYFLKQADKVLSYGIEDDGDVDEADLTEPMYEFVRFLQIYNENNNSTRFQEELAFFEKHVIEGHLHSKRKGILVYNSNTGISDIPMYLASSMINEVAPIFMAMSSKNYYDHLIIDEIDASLHPEKQLELVRFLNRLYNKGITLILSTHSDAFASRLNNLYILSQKVKGNEKKLSKFDWEMNDLIPTQDLFVYEFVNQSNGMSIVRPIEGQKDTGFQFDLFAKSALELYEEIVAIEGIQ